MTLAQIISHTKEYGFIYPSSEIYEGLQAVYDYGPYGVLLKRNLQEFWFKTMTQLHANIVGLDAAILMAPRTWEASGHVAGFNDFLVDNKDSKKRYRADVLLEAKATELSEQGKGEEAQALLDQLYQLMQQGDGGGLTQLLRTYCITCPVSKTSAWTEARQFNLMFSTQVGAVHDESTTVYLRPETAQGIFVNFLNVQQSTRMAVPFGIAQIGKAFRNEIIARQFTFRMREFEQMEMQFFCRPGEEQKWFEYWTRQRQGWYDVLGIPSSKRMLQPHKQLAHYAAAAVDITYEFPFGYKEVEGLHSRTDFDLRAHEQYSGKKMHYFDPELGRSYTPYVIETSAGCDRLVLMLLCEAFTQETLADGKERTYLKLPAALAPVKVAVLPLLKKAELSGVAAQLYQEFQYHLAAAFESTGSIGKRYTRQDLIGTPYCITIDYQTLEDQTVTLRERDSMAQERIAMDRVVVEVCGRVNIATLLRKVAMNDEL